MKKNHTPGLTLIVWYMVFLLALFAAAVIGCDDGKARRPIPGPGHECVLAFSATWCGPCCKSKPAVDAIEASGVDIRRVDVDRYPDETKKWGVESIPTFIVLHDGLEVARTGDVSELGRLLRESK